MEFDVPPGSHPHDVAPAADGGVWYTGQRNGTLGLLDPATGAVTEIPLGDGSRPHGVIVGPDGAPWITDGGLDAIVRVDPASHAVDVFPLPEERRGANLNTATFDGDGMLWFTGQTGVYGRLDPATGRGGGVRRARWPRAVRHRHHPDGRGLVRVARGEPHRAHRHHDRARRPGSTHRRPTRARVGSGPIRSAACGSPNGTPGSSACTTRPRTSGASGALPGDDPAAYAVYVDDQDVVWLTDFGANAIVRFDPATETFTPVPLPDADAAVRQLLGRPGEVWGAESGLDRLVVVRSG